MKSSWMYIGFSHHSVPSLSKTATRASRRNVIRATGRADPPTKSTIAAFVGPVGPGFEFGHGQPPPVARNFSSFFDGLVDREEAGSWRGGNSLNVSRNCVTIAERVEHEEDRSIIQSQYVFDVMSACSNGSVRRLNNFGSAQPGEGLGPDLQRARAALLHEHDLPVVEADAEHVAVVGEVDQSAAAGSSPPRRSGRAAGCSRRCAPCSVVSPALCPS